MSKVRVYELAKELDVESKELVEKLKAGGLNIKNHMSNLDEDTVNKARDIISGVSLGTSEVIEEKRIKPTVIRRRKKVVQVEEEKIEEPIAEEPKAVEGKKIEDEIPSAEEKEVSDGAAAAPEIDESLKGQEVPIEEGQEREEELAEEGVLPEEPEAEKKGFRVRDKKTRKKTKDRPAKIIKMPEEGPLKEIIAKEKEKAPPSPPSRPDLEVAPIETGISPEPEDETQAKVSKKKKGKKKGEKKDVDPDSGVRIRHRKLEVFERADLYEDRKPRLKDRKTGKKTRETAKRLRQTEITVPRASKRRLKVQENVTVSELAKAMGVKGAELLKKLLVLGVMANINTAIDFETACLTASF